MQHWTHSRELALLDISLLPERCANICILYRFFQIRTLIFSYVLQWNENCVLPKISDGTPNNMVVTILPSITTKERLNFKYRQTINFIMAGIFVVFYNSYL